MCTTCGCGDETNSRVSGVGDLGALLPAHDVIPTIHTPRAIRPRACRMSTTTGTQPAGPQTIPLEQNLLAKNDLLAARNRGWLEGRGIRALNVMSSPGAGKTTLLVRTPRGPGRTAAGRRHRGRPGDVAGRRPHPRAGPARHPDQHRSGLPPRRRHAPARPWTPWTRRPGRRCSSKTSATWSARRSSTWAKQPR